MWENMVDTNQDTTDKKELVKKKKELPKKSAPKNVGTKTKEEDKGVVKKLSVKKEAAPAKSQNAAKASSNSAKKQSFSFDGIRKFAKGAWSELKKVRWPNRRELVAFTSVVLVAVTLVAVMIFAVDSVLSRVLDFIIKK